MRYRRQFVVRVQNRSGPRPTLKGLLLTCRLRRSPVSNTTDQVSNPCGCVNVYQRPMKPSNQSLLPFVTRAKLSTNLSQGLSSVGTCPCEKHTLDARRHWASLFPLVTKKAARRVRCLPKTIRFLQHSLRARQSARTGWRSQSRSLSSELARGRTKTLTHCLLSINANAMESSAGSGTTRPGESTETYGGPREVIDSPA